MGPGQTPEGICIGKLCRILTHIQLNHSWTLINPHKYVSMPNCLVDIAIPWKRARSNSLVSCPQQRGCWVAKALKFACQLDRSLDTFSNLSNLGSLGLQLLVPSFSLTGFTADSPLLWGHCCSSMFDAVFPGVFSSCQITISTKT